jgi:hypothetical protein
MSVGTPAGRITSKDDSIGKGDTDLRCDPVGGTVVANTLSNPGRRVARIDTDFRLKLEVIRQGRQPGNVLFVFPAPGWDRIWRARAARSSSRWARRSKVSRGST